MNHVTVQCRDQSKLLEEAVRDLEVFKKAYYKAEGDIRAREERFEQEKQVLNDEIHQLKVRLHPHLIFSLWTSTGVSTFLLQFDLKCDANHVMLMVPLSI